MTTGNNSSIIKEQKRKGKTKMENVEKIKFWLEKYEELNGCNCYEIYFNFKHEIYKIELKKLDV